jgi:hypothetical protein
LRWRALLSDRLKGHPRLNEVYSEEMRKVFLDSAEKWNNRWTVPIHRFGAARGSGANSWSAPFDLSARQKTPVRLCFKDEKVSTKSHNILLYKSLRLKDVIRKSIPSPSPFYIPKMAPVITVPFACFPIARFSAGHFDLPVPVTNFTTDESSNHSPASSVLVVAVVVCLLDSVTNLALETLGRITSRHPCSRLRQSCFSNFDRSSSRQRAGTQRITYCLNSSRRTRLPARLLLKK